MYNHNGNVGRAYEAVFYYCIQEFNTTVTNSILETVQTNAWANESDPDAVDGYLSDAPVAILKDPYDDTEYEVDGNTMWAIRNFTNQVMTGWFKFENGIYGGDAAWYSTDFARAFSLLGGVHLPAATTPQQTIGGQLACLAT